MTQDIGEGNVRGGRDENGTAEVALAKLRGGREGGDVDDDDDDRINRSFFILPMICPH